MKSLIKKFACAAYEWMDHHWEPFIERKDQPLVRLVDLFANHCKYCTAYRMLLLGAGLGVAVGAALPWWAFAAGAGLSLFVVLIVVIERLACRYE